MGFKREKVFTKHNGEVLALAWIIKNVMASAAEAKLGAAYINSKDTMYLKIILEEMGHPQRAVQIRMDNSTEEGIVNGKIKQKRSNTMDICFHWLKDRVKRG